MSIQFLSRVREHTAWASAVEAAQEGTFDEVAAKGCRRHAMVKYLSQLGMPGREVYDDFDSLRQNTDTLVRRCASCGALETKRGEFKKCAGCADVLEDCDVPAYCSTNW